MLRRGPTFSEETITGAIFESFVKGFCVHVAVGGEDGVGADFGECIVVEPVGFVVAGMCSGVRKGTRLPARLVAGFAAGACCAGWVTY